MYLWSTTEVAAERECAMGREASAQDRGTRDL
jgi:hypothetical protein